MKPILIGAALLAVVACKSKDKDAAPAPAPAPTAPAPAAPAPAAPAPAAPAPADKPYQMQETGSDSARAEGQYRMKGPSEPMWRPIPHMGLQVHVPGDAEYRNTGDHDAPGAQFTRPDYSCSPRINQTGAGDTTDIDKAKAEVAKSGKVTWTKAEKTGDDWTLVYSYTDADAPHDTHFGVRELRKIGAHTYECWDESTTAEGGACGVHACDSLKPL